jgi:hypothetical protein
MNELLKQFNAAGVRYLLIGGQAMRLTGMPRSTMELSITRVEKGAQVKCLSGIHLLAAKMAANRPQDQADIKFLLELKNLGKL